MWSLSLALVARDEQKINIAVAQTRLMEGDLEGLSDLFSTRTFLGKKSQGALPALSIQFLERENEPAFRVSDLPRTVLASGQLPALVAGLYHHGQFDASLELAQFGQRQRTGHPVLPLFASAALLGLGNEQAAARMWFAIPDELRASPMGQTLREVLDLRELGYRRFLRDRQGELVGAVDSEGVFYFVDGIDYSLIPEHAIQEAIPSLDGSSTLLSFDLELSRMALEALGYYRGSIVAVRPDTGEMLAAVSDRITVRRERSAAFQQMREPASIAKLITTAAALRNGIDPDFEISRMRCPSFARYRGGILYCPYRAGQLRGLDHAMAVSCNIAFANLGMKVGRRELLSEFERWGFAKFGGNPIAYGEILERSGDERQLADLSIGLEDLDITPLHAALMAATVAGAGVMPDPVIVLREGKDPGLFSREKPVLRAERVFKPQWAAILTQSMEAVVDWGGTAANVAPHDFPVAMKTGTAALPPYGYHVNYIGFTRASDPVVAFCIRITHQPTSRRVSMAAKLVTQRFLTYLSRWHGEAL